MVEKQTMYEDEPIIGSGLLLPTDKNIDTNVVMKEKKKVDPTKCALERI